MSLSEIPLEIFPNSSTYRPAYRRPGISPSRFVVSRNQLTGREDRVIEFQQSPNEEEGRIGDGKAEMRVGGSETDTTGRVFSSPLLLGEAGGHRRERRRAIRNQFGSSGSRRRAVCCISISRNFASISRARSPETDPRKRIFIALSYRRMGKASSDARGNSSLCQTFPASSPRWSSSLFRPCHFTLFISFLSRKTVSSVLPRCSHSLGRALRGLERHRTPVTHGSTATPNNYAYPVIRGQLAHSVVLRSNID